MKKSCVKIVAGDPTPLQCSAWARLWALLLSPELQGTPATVSSTVAGLQTLNVASEDEREDRRSDEQSIFYDTTRPD
jgi:hypothetical protein